MTRAVAESMPRLPLSHFLAEKPSWSLRKRLILVRRLALAVGVLHRQGQIHRSHERLLWLGAPSAFGNELRPIDSNELITY